MYIEGLVTACFRLWKETNRKQISHIFNKQPLVLIDGTFLCLYY